MSHELRSKLRHTLFTSAYANRRVRRLRHITTHRLSHWLEFILNYVVAYLNKVNVQRNKFNLILIDVWH